MSVKDEQYQHILDLQNEIDCLTKELQCMSDFLSWTDSWDEFVQFRVNAHLEQDESEPFPHYVL